MHWADYSKTQKKAKVHVGFDINRGFPRKLCLTDCKVDERPYASRLLEKGQTGVMDRNYQKYEMFDLLAARRNTFRLPHQVRCR